MYPDNSTRLRHMRDAAREALAFAEGKQRTDLDNDRQLALAMLKCIEIVGEAAIGVSKQLQAEHPEIPWAAIVSMRHRLVHGYFSIDLDRVWDTVQKNVPDLLAGLLPILDGFP